MNVLSQQILLGKKKKTEERAWEKTDNWSNPFGEDSVSANDRKKKDKKKRKKRSSKKRYTDDELSEMSSQADTLLEDLLGEEEEGANENKMAPVAEEIGDDDSECAVMHGMAVNNNNVTNPFDDSEEEADAEGFDKQNFKNLLKKSHGEGVQALNTNPFADDFNEEDTEADDEASHGNKDDDDSTIEPPPADDDESIAESIDDDCLIDHLDTVKAEERGDPTETTLPNSFDQSDASEDPADEDYSSDDQSDSEENSKQTPTAETSDDEDIIESSKRLLRMADKRLQYQQHNDEVNKLKIQLETMKMQAEAMSEQLRRAVETKCDLVLAQTEMERCHEQDLIAKDDEIKDLTSYARELMEEQANIELNFMNEVSSLSKKMEKQAANHKTQLMKKDFKMAQMEMKVSSMQTESARGFSSRDAFKSRFLASGPVSTGAVLQSVECI